MKTIVWHLAKRNLMRYYRDKGALLFSLLSVIIVVALNIFFLADMQIDHIKTNYLNAAGIDELVYRFVLGGLLCIPAVSVPLMLLTFKVDDAAQKVQDDLFVTPADRSLIMLGYVMASWVAGMIMTLLTFVIGEAFIVLSGGQMLSLAAMLQVIGIVVFAILVFSFFSFFIIMNLKTSSSLTIVNTMLNTLIGFLAGLYVPFGFMSEGISGAIKAFPLSHAAALLRQIMMAQPMENLFAAAPAEAVKQIRQGYGMDIAIGGHVFEPWETVLYLIGFGAFFFAGSAFFMTRYKRRNA